MRTELAEIVRTRYGEHGVTTTSLIIPTDEEVSYYERHNGLVSLWVNLERNPSLVIIDTARLLLLRHAWVAKQKPDAIRLVLASDNHPISSYRDQRC